MYLSVAGIVMIAGIFIYFVLNNAKWQEIGRIMFAFGLLALLVGADRFKALFER